jgi:hypothetical protein
MTQPLGRRGILANLAAMAAPVSQAAAWTPSGIPAARGFSSGVVTHFIQRADGLEQSLDTIREAGFTSIRDEVYWHLVEQERGRLVMPDIARAMVAGAVARGLEPVLTLGYGNPHWDGRDKPRSPEAIAAFARYAAAVATAFRGRVRTYEVWNEWQGTIGATTVGTPDDYLRLLSATSAALRLVDPEIRVLADEVIMADGDEVLVSRMARARVFDMIDGMTVHPYFYNRGDDRTPEAWARQMLLYDGVLSRHSGRRSVPLWVTETGWPSHVGRYGVSRQRQAAMAARLFLLARTLPMVPGIWWYDFQDDGSNPAEPEHNFGIVTKDFLPKMVLPALGAVNRLLLGARFLRQVDAGDPGSWVLAFQTSSGEEAWALWHTEEAAPRTVRLAGAPPDLRMLSLSPSEGRPVAGTLSRHAELVLSEWPVLLQGRLDRVNRVAKTLPEARRPRQ